MNRGVIALAIAGVAAIALAAWFVVIQVEARQGTTAEIASVAFNQHQSVQDFDDAEYTQDDPRQLAEFRAMLDEYGVTLGVTETADPDDACPGALTTSASVKYEDGEVADLFLSTCGANPRYEDFNNAATALLTTWREDLSR